MPENHEGTAVWSNTADIRCATDPDTNSKPQSSSPVHRVCACVCVFVCVCIYVHACFCKYACAGETTLLNTLWPRRFHEPFCPRWCLASEHERAIARRAPLKHSLLPCFALPLVNHKSGTRVCRVSRSRWQEASVGDSPLKRRHTQKEKRSWSARPHDVRMIRLAQQKSLRKCSNFRICISCLLRALEKGLDDNRVACIAPRSGLLQYPFVGCHSGSIKISRDLHAKPPRSQDSSPPRLPPKSPSRPNRPLPQDQVKSSVEARLFKFIKFSLSSQ